MWAGLPVGEKNKNSGSLPLSLSWVALRFNSRSENKITGSPIENCVLQCYFLNIATPFLEASVLQKNEKTKTNKKNLYCHLVICQFLPPVSFLTAQSAGFEDRVSLAQNKRAVLWEMRRHQNKMKISFHSSFQNVHPVHSERHETSVTEAGSRSSSVEPRTETAPNQLPTVSSDTSPCASFCYVIMWHNSILNCSFIIKLYYTVPMKTGWQLNHLHSGCCSPCLINRARGPYNAARSDQNSDVTMKMSAFCA